MFCSLEQENILAVTLQPVLNYLVTSEFLLFFFFSVWSMLPWMIDPFWCSEVLWFIVAFFFRTACGPALHSHLRAVLIINIVLFKEEHLYRRLVLCCKLFAAIPNFSCFANFWYLVEGQGSAFSRPVTRGNREMRGDSCMEPSLLCLKHMGWPSFTLDFTMGFTAL